MNDEHTYQLLERWHSGDEDALGRILERDLPWIRKRVEERCGDALRRRIDDEDIVQEAMLEVLRYGPRFLMSDRDQFRGLMVRIIENVIRGQHDFHNALRRELAREKPLPAQTRIDLDPAARSVTRPSQALDRNEREACVRLALELLDREDRDILLLRQWKELSFVEVGERLGISENTARMRFNRALPKLARKVEQLETGAIDRALQNGS
ncbi:MAG: sigma-70 family RNA polymerase sigma factor [Planctomycetes bacterium]|nr:sigma-70 family RNA polymerase sigma factor [Planctomycetota bacterium]